MKFFVRDYILKSTLTTFVDVTVQTFNFWNDFSTPILERRLSRGCNYARVDFMIQTLVLVLYGTLLQNSLPFIMRRNDRLLRCLNDLSPAEGNN